MRKKTPTKKMLGTMPLHSDADVKRYIGFVTESHREEIKAFGENISRVEEKVDKGFHEMRVELSSHKEMIGRLMLDMEEVKSGMREKIDRKEFTALVKRMVLLEAFVFGGKSKQKTK